MDKLKTFTRNKRTNVNMDTEVLQKTSHGRYCGTIRQLADFGG
jgi:hypothetical protein